MREPSTSHNMSDLERTSAGLQMVIPGCERRTLPKSTSRVDGAGQGLFASTGRRACESSLRRWARHPCAPAGGKRQCREAVCLAFELLPSSELCSPGRLRWGCLLWWSSRIRDHPQNHPGAEMMARIGMMQALNRHSPTADPVPQRKRAKAFRIGSPVNDLARWSRPG